MAIAWTLGRKFTLFLILIGLLGSGLAVSALSGHLNAQAERAVKERAELILTATQAARNYTRDYIQPMLEQSPDRNEEFVRESVPNFAARTIFADFRQQNQEFRDFLYKEAAVNPTNPSDRADEFEHQLVLQLQARLPSSEGQVLSGYRTVNGEKLFYLARPLVMNDVKCLNCHGRPSDAPQHLLDMYGDRNGFGWQLNDIVATQMMYVPATRIFDRGRENLLAITNTLLGIFGALLLAVNLLLWRTVIRPLSLLTKTANRISSCFIHQRQMVPAGDRNLGHLVLRRDEPGQLARSFEYMLYVLGQHEQDLQQAVQERTRSLELEMRDRQTAQAALQTYSHAVNHDLRNMVMGIANLLQAVQFRRVRDENASPAIEIEPKAFDMMQRSCDRQLVLMNSLMEVQAADAWRAALQWETVNVSQLLAEIEAAHTPKLLAANSTLDIRMADNLPPIQADPNQLQRVFENLLDNALKYNPTGVAIAMTLEIDRNDPSQLHCQVSDNGIGLCTNEERDLFNIYARGQLSSQASGYGLGLYICRQIIEAHGGEIGCEALPRGVTFWFTLPIST